MYRMLSADSTIVVIHSGHSYSCKNNVTQVSVDKPTMLNCLNTCTISAIQPKVTVTLRKSYNQQLKCADKTAG